MTELAEQTTTTLLAGVGTRLRHSRCVASQAMEASACLDPLWRQTVVTAAWLHDIGYSPLATDTGLHALDGARWARAHGFDEDVCCLIAWHTGAVFEAKVRELEGELRAEFRQPATEVLDALTWADLTSSPTGQPITADARVEEILRRYEPEEEVHRAITLASNTLRDSARRVEQQLKVGCG